MRITRNMIAILRNFSKINYGLGFEKGPTLRTSDRRKMILAEAVLDEECPADACLYLLKDFLALIARSEPPLELIFDTTASKDFPQGCVSVQEVETQKRIGSVALGPPDWIKTPPKTQLVGEKDLAFDLTAADLAYLTIQPDTSKIMLCSSGDSVRLQKMEDDSILGFIEVRNTITHSAPFQGVIKTEYLKRLMTGPYSVAICGNNFAHFLYKGFPLEYWVGLEKRGK